MRAWLVLSRLSNLPTVWSNVLAGGLIAGGATWEALDSGVVVVSIAVSLMYIGGMVLNDVCDAAHDAAHRPTRPIPQGTIARSTAAVVGSGQMLLGVGLVWWWAPGVQTLVWSAALVGVIVYYDVRHKRDPAAFLAMGVCRGLVYCVAAVAMGGTLGVPLVVGALVMTAYVGGFTLAARHVSGVGPWVSWCIAAISLVDAGALVVVGQLGRLVGRGRTVVAERWASVLAVQLCLCD